MSIQAVVFYLLATVIAVSATVATFARSIVNAAYALFFTLFCLAGVYVLLGADFVAVTQVVIYVGGILVLLLFGILLTNRNFEDMVSDAARRYWVAIVPGMVIFAIICTIVVRTAWPVLVHPNLAGTTVPLGYLLLNKYLLPFEYSSITLLAALIGAAYLVRSKDRD